MRFGCCNSAQEYLQSIRFGLGPTGSDADAMSERKVGRVIRPHCCGPLRCHPLPANSTQHVTLLWTSVAHFGLR
jgi:hypothetical protein